MSCGRLSALVNVTRPPTATVTSDGENPVSLIVTDAASGGLAGPGVGGLVCTGGVGAVGFADVMLSLAPLQAHKKRAIISHTNVGALTRLSHLALVYGTTDAWAAVCAGRKKMRR